MNNNFNTGERLRELRTAQGLSQEQLALHAEITTTYLGLVERNLKNPTIKIIEQLCHSLHISLADFFDPSHKPTCSLDPLSAQILFLVDNRTKEEKQLILQLTKNLLKMRDLPDMVNIETEHDN